MTQTPDLEPVTLSPEAAYQLLVDYFTDAIKPATHALYARHLGAAQLNKTPSTDGMVEPSYPPVVAQLRSLLTDMPVILEAFHQLIALHWNPNHERAHETPQHHRLEPIFDSKDPSVGV